MTMTKETILTQLLHYYEAFYDIYPYEESSSPIVARCEYIEHSGQYLFSKKTELWSIEQEEFLYLLKIPHLTLPIFEQWREQLCTDGLQRMHIGPGHLLSRITVLFVCDICDTEARQALQKCRISKSFHFSLHGWMHFQTVVISTIDRKITANRTGNHTAKILKKMLSL